MFLSAGKFLPRMEKLAGKLFHARHKFFSLQDTLSQLLASYKFGLFDANFARFCFILPLQISLISWLIGCPVPPWWPQCDFQNIAKKGNYKGSPTHVVFATMVFLFKYVQVGDFYIRPPTVPLRLTSRNAVYQNLC